MDVSQWTLVLIALVACGYASFTDFRTRRVPNACTFGLIGLGTLFHLFQVLFGEESVITFLILFVVSGGIGFLLYRFGFMGAGDAKLFWGFCLILPPGFFQDMAGRPVFPPVVLALNLFGVFFFGTLAYLLWKSTKAQKRQAIFEFPWKETPKRFVELLGFLGFGSIIYTALRQWFPSLDFRLGAFMRLLLILGLFLGYRSAMNLHPTLKRYWILPILIGGMFLFRSQMPPLKGFLRQLLTMAGLYVLAFFVFRMLYLQLGAHLLSREAPIRQLTPGTIVAESLWQLPTPSGAQYLKAPLMSRPPENADPGKNAKRVFTAGLKGLSMEQIHTLKELAEQGAFQSFGDRIRVQEPLCFAPIISLGVVLTLICQGVFYSNPVLARLLS